MNPMKVLMAYLIFCLAGLSGCGLLGGEENDPAIPGKIVFAAKDDSENPTYQIFTMNADGSDLRQLTDGEFFCVSPAWSPDGTRIAFASNRQAPDGSTTLWVMDADGDNLQPLVLHPQTGRPMFGGHPTWSPDGTKLAFDYCIDCELGGKNSEVFLADLQAGTLDTLVRHPARDSHPTWRPSGNQIAFVSSRAYPEEGGSDVYVIKLSTEILTRFTQTGNAGRQLWYENGEKLIYWSDNRLYSLELTNGQPRLISLDFDAETGFRPLTLLEEGDRILLHVFSYKNPDLNHSLQVLSLDTKQLKPITSGSGFNGADWSVTADN